MELNLIRKALGEHRTFAKDKSQIFYDLANTLYDFIFLMELERLNEFLLLPL